MECALLCTNCISVSRHSRLKPEVGVARHFRFLVFFAGYFVCQINSLDGARRLPFAKYWSDALNPSDELISHTVAAVSFVIFASHSTHVGIIFMTVLSPPPSWHPPLPQLPLPKVVWRADKALTGQSGRVQTLDGLDAFKTYTRPDCPVMSLSARHNYRCYIFWRLLRRP